MARARVESDSVSATARWHEVGGREADRAGAGEEGSVQIDTSIIAPYPVIRTEARCDETRAGTIRVISGGVSCALRSVIFEERGAAMSQDFQLRILCVEESQTDFEIASALLRDSKAPPHELVWAQSVQEALRLLTDSLTRLFDIVLLDLTLPDSHGERTLREIQSAVPDIAITVLTGLTDDGLGLRLVQAGAQDFLPKEGLSAECLLRTIMYAVERKRNQQELRRANSQLKSANERLSDAEKHLIQSEKLESLGRMAAGVAHEVKNPLAILQMGVDFFTRRCNPEDHRATEMLGSMKDAIERANTIVLGMVDLSRPSEMEVVPQNINDLIRKSLEMVRYEVISNHVDLKMELLEELPLVPMDWNKIEQTVINLVTNAAHAIGGEEKGRGMLRIRTMLGEVEHSAHNDGYRQFERLRRNDEIVVVEFRDNGPGIPTDQIHHVYEPFFTTKPTGKGTGLGLSVVKSIMQQHNGSIHLDNVEHPQGLRVRLIFKVSSRDQPVTVG